MMKLSSLGGFVCNGGRVAWDLSPGGLWGMLPFVAALGQSWGRVCRARNGHVCYAGVASTFILSVLKKYMHASRTHGCVEMYL